MVEPREFHHVRFDDRLWMKLMDEGYKVFISYMHNGELRETASCTTFPFIDQARHEEAEAWKNGLNDTEDGKIPPEHVMMVEIRKGIFKDD